MAVKPVNVGAFTFYLFVTTKLNLIAALRLSERCRMGFYLSLSTLGMNCIL